MTKTRSEELRWDLAVYLAGITGTLVLRSIILEAGAGVGACFTTDLDTSVYLMTCIFMKIVFAKDD